MEKTTMQHTGDTPSHDDLRGQGAEQITEAERRYLRLLRWLAEQGLLEHPVAGPPAGPFASACLGDDPQPR